MVEHLEAKNHQAALEYLFSIVGLDYSLSEEFILKLHGILMNSLRPDAGFYRNHGVRIIGTNVPTANYAKIPALINELVKEMNKQEKDVVGQCARIHGQFERIHPFADGNGRVGRLIIQTMLLRKNYPPAIIEQTKKRIYIKYLNKAQMEGDTSLLEDFLCDAIAVGFGLLSTSKSNQ